MWLNWAENHINKSLLADSLWHCGQSPPPFMDWVTVHVHSVVCWLPSEPLSS